METIVLDPSEVATGRVEFDITQWIDAEGVDWGDAEITAYMAEQARGSSPVDFRVPNRTVTAPLIAKTRGTVTFDQFRQSIQAKVARIQQEGGWLKRVTSSGGTVYADVVNATLKLGGGWLQAHRDADPDAVLTLEAIPDWYGDEITLADHVETTNPELVFTETGIDGDYPGRVRIVVDDDSGQRQRGLIYGIRSRHYDPAETAALVYEPAKFTPLDQAKTSGIDGILHPGVGSNWTPIFNTTMLPTVRAVGTVANGIGNITPGLPAGWQENDIFLLFIETQNEAVTPPSGWAHVTGSPVSVAAGVLTRLTVLWKRATASESAPTVTDPGDHAIGRIMAVRGCITTGNPWDVTATGTELVSDNTVSIPGATTTVNGCLVVAAVTTGTDVSSTSHTSAWANADLQGIINRIDNWTTDGGGGGVGVAVGPKTTAGAYGATTAQVATNAEKAMMSIALKPPVSGGTALTHEDTYRVWAKVQEPNATTGLSLRWVWDVGDLAFPVENTGVRLPAPSDDFLLDLGEIRLDPTGVGTHRWEGQLQGKSDAGGDNVLITRLYFVPVDDGYGKITAPVSADPGLTTYTARDEFNQSSGVLTGKVAASGQTYTVVASSDADDFLVDTTAHDAERSAISDAIVSGRHVGRMVTLGTGTLTDVAIQADIKRGVAAASSWQLVAARIVDINTHLWAGWAGADTAGNGNWVVGMPNSGGSGWTFYHESSDVHWDGTNWYTIRLAVLSDGTYHFWVFPQGGSAGTPLLTGRHTNLATGGSLATGKYGIYEMHGSTSAAARQWDNLAVWVPPIDAVLYPNQSAELSTHGVFREDSTGTGSGPITPIGGLPRLPPSGSEGRTAEVFLRASRGDLGQLPDLGTDDISARVHYRPSWLIVPGT